MKKKLLNLGLLLTSLLGYLEWGQGNKMFLFQMEGEILSKLFSDPLGVLHPFVILPLIGQIILLCTLFQKQPAKALTYIGLACVALLLLLIFFIGIISSNVKLLFSTLPFLLIAILVIREHRKRKNIITFT